MIWIEFTQKIEPLDKKSLCLLLQEEKKVNIKQQSIDFGCQVVFFSPECSF